MLFRAHRWLIAGLVIIAGSFSSPAAAQVYDDDPMAMGLSRTSPSPPPPPATQTVQKESSDPERQGFTLQLSTGIGIASILYAQGDSQSYAGLGGLNVGVGGFLSRNFALLFKGTMVLFGPFSNVFDSALTATLGPVLQFWPADWVYLGAGAGLGINHIAYNTRCNCSASQWEVGASISGDVGFVLHGDKHQAVGLFAGIAFVPSANNPMLGTQFGVVWQYY